MIGVRRGELPNVSRLLFQSGAYGLQEDAMPGQAVPPRQPWDSGPEPPATTHLVVRAWFEDPDRVALQSHVAQLCHTSGWAAIDDDRDWDAEWRASFKPIRVSERITIAPPWDHPAGALIIEPGQGFGTGEHPTTQMALGEVDRLATGLSTCVDIGCGSGVLGIAAHMLGVASVRGVDVEAEAIENAQANALANDAICNFSTTPVASLMGPSELVLGNLHAELICALSQDIIRLSGRFVVLAGILSDREQMVTQLFEDAFNLD